jgi:hypothetical protein
VILFFWPTHALIPSLSRDVGEPPLYGAGLDVLLAPDRFQARGKAFLKSSIAST